MKEKEALENVRQMMLAVQKYRSNAFEVESNKTLLTDLNAWVFDDGKCPLPAMQKVLNRDRLDPQEYYNFCFILKNFMPEVDLSMGIMGFKEVNMPEISLIANGWEE